PVQGVAGAVVAPGRVDRHAGGRGRAAEGPGDGGVGGLVVVLGQQVPHRELDGGGRRGAVAVAARLLVAHGAVEHPGGGEQPGRRGEQVVGVGGQQPRDHPVAQGAPSGVAPERVDSLAGEYTVVRRLLVLAV